MSKLTVTNFSSRTGSPFQNIGINIEKNNLEDDVFTSKDESGPISNNAKQKLVQNELLVRVNRKTAEISNNKPPSSDGVFTEVITHGAFTAPKPTVTKTEAKSPHKPTNGNSSKSLMGFPSSANDLALEAKTDLESDKNISNEVKEKVIEKLFALVSMVQHTYESKVRLQGEYEKFKDKSYKDEVRREKEHSEQLYKMNIHFQTEVVQALQQLKTESDISRGVPKGFDQEPANCENNEYSYRLDVTHEKQNEVQNYDEPKEQLLCTESIEKVE